MNEHITRVSLDVALDADRTDWAWLAAQSDAELDAAIAADVDTFALPERGDLRFVVFQDAGQSWRWRLTDAAGKAIADSPTGYRLRSEADGAIRSFREALKAA